MFLFYSFQKYPAQSCALLCQLITSGSGSDLGHGVYFPYMPANEAFKCSSTKDKKEVRDSYAFSELHPAKCFDACIRKG